MKLDYFLKTVCKCFTFVIILTQASLLEARTIAKLLRTTQGNITNCEQDFEKNVQQCLDGLYLYKWQTDVLNFRKTHIFFREIFKQHLCRQYTDSLQCLHELLKACSSDDTTRTVRIYLRQSWARKYDNLCDINQQNSSAKTHNSMIESKNSSTAFKNTSEKQEHREQPNLIEIVTVLKALKNIHNHAMQVPVTKSEQSKMNAKLPEKIESSNGGAGESNSQTGNSRNKYLNQFQLYAKSITKAGNQKHNSEKPTDLENSLLFHSLLWDKSKLPASVTVNRNSKEKQPKESLVEMMIVVEG